MGYAIAGVVIFLAGFIVGILVGRKNPKKAEMLANAADQVKRGASKF